MRNFLARHKRALIAVIAAGAMAWHGIAADTGVEWAAQLAVSVLYAAGVYLVPDLVADGVQWVKPTVAAMLAAAQAAVLAAGGGITGAEWVNVGLAAAGALGILVVPNAPPPLTAARRRIA